MMYNNKSISTKKENFFFFYVWILLIVIIIMIIDAPVSIIALVGVLLIIIFTFTIIIFVDFYTTFCNYCKFIGYNTILIPVTKKKLIHSVIITILLLYIVSLILLKFN